MSKIEHLLTFLFQLFFSAGSLFLVYFFFLIADLNGGFDGIVGLFLNLAIIGSPTIGATLLICLIVGLPVRFNKAINRVFSNNPILSIAGIITAITLLTTSIINYWNASNVRDNPMGEYYKSVSTPFITITIIGWFTLAFFTVHFYPVMLIKKINSLFPIKK